MALGDSREHVRKEAIAELVRLGNLAVGPLIYELRNKNTSVRLGVVEALGEFNPNHVVKSLTSALKDRSSRVRNAAATSLGKLESAAAVERI